MTKSDPSAWLAGHRRAAYLRENCHKCDKYRCPALVKAFNLYVPGAAFVNPRCWRKSGCVNKQERRKPK